MSKTALLTAILACSACSILAEPNPKEANVCNETVTVKKEKAIDVPIKYELKTQGICSGFLPCTKTKYETRYDTQVTIVYEDNQRRVCCPGYAETPDKKCSPICFNSCIHGTCTAPNKCSCSPEPSLMSPGYAGSLCTRHVCLIPNRWGSKCDKECSCNPNSFCDASTGKCICRAGFRGANCEEECELDSKCGEPLIIPPVIEPEVNVISDELPRASGMNLMMEETKDDSSKTITSLIAAHMTINFLCLFVTSILIFAIFYYKKRLQQLRNNIYYGGAYSSAGSNSSESESPYYTSVTSNMSNRPRMPTPLEGDFLSKNVSFATATRNILSLNASEKDLSSVSNDSECRKKLVLDPKTESHLIASQKSSGANIYSENQILNVSTDADRSKLIIIPDDSEYAVPKPSPRPNTLTEEISSHDNTYHIIEPRQLPDLDESIYEEIKPNKRY